MISELLRFEGGGGTSDSLSDTATIATIHSEIDADTGWHCFPALVVRVGFHWVVFLAFPLWIFFFLVVAAASDGCIFGSDLLRLRPCRIIVCFVDF